MPVNAFRLPHITERLDPSVDWQKVIDEGIPCYFWEEDDEEKKVGVLDAITRFNGRIAYYMRINSEHIYPYKNCKPVEEAK